MTAISRRTLLIGGGALLAPRAGFAAGGALELEWQDLIPAEGSGTEHAQMRAVLGIVQHGDLSTGFFQQRNVSVTTDYDGQTVRIPGFVVPLEYDGVGVSTFLLVPYVGACIHVPPPPPNQIVYVTATTPFEIQGYFEPVFVTGTIHTNAVATELAEIGYTITQAEVEPYA